MLTRVYVFRDVAYEKADMLDKALELFGEQIDSGIEPDIITYSSLLSACAKARDMKTALELLDAMHSQGIVGPHQIYHNLIYACGESWQYAVEVFLGMQCAGVVVTPQTLNNVMSSLCKGKQKDHAMWLFQQSCAAKMTLSHMAYSKLLQMLADDGDYHAADRVHESMVSAKMVMDGHTAGLIISAHMQGGDSHESINALNADFEAKGISPVLLVKQEVVEHHVSPIHTLGARHLVADKGLGRKSVGTSGAEYSIDSAHSEVTELDLDHHTISTV